MKVEDLEDNISTFKNSQSAIEEKRAIWTASARASLISTLKLVIDHHKLTADVQEINLYKNYEAINLTMGHHRSGITKEKPDEIRHFNKFRGALSFSQSYNGNIDVIILYPHIEEITTLTEKDVISQVAPSELTESFILKQIDKFITELIMWEKSPQVPSVGYRFSERKEIITIEKKSKL